MNTDLQIQVRVPDAQCRHALHALSANLMSQDEFATGAAEPKAELSAGLTAIESAPKEKVGNGFRRVIDISEPAATAIISELRAAQQVLRHTDKREAAWAHSKVRRTADAFQKAVNEAIPDLDAPTAAAASSDCPF